MRANIPIEKYFENKKKAVLKLDAESINMIYKKYDKKS